MSERIGYHNQVILYKMDYEEFTQNYEWERQQCIFMKLSFVYVKCERLNNLAL